MQSVYGAPAKRRRLAEPKAEHALDRDEAPILLGHGLDDPVDVVSLEEGSLLVAYLGEVRASGDVPRDPLLPDRHIEHRREHDVALPNPARG